MVTAVNTCRSLRLPSMRRRRLTIRLCITSAHWPRASDGQRPSPIAFQPIHQATYAAILAPTALKVHDILAMCTAGVSREADANGFFTYQRPEGKSGGHGVGWSEIPRYAFKVPAGV